MRPRCTWVAGVVLLASAANVNADVARRELTLADAIAVALAHNGDIYVSQADVTIAADEIDLARSVFTPKFIANTRFLTENQPGNSFRFAWTDSQLSSNVELDGRFRSGTSYVLSYGLLSDHYSSPFTTVWNPAYTTALTLTLTQPLLRNRGTSTNLQPMVAAARRRDLTEQALRVQLEEIIGEIEVAYWQLALASKEREARKQSLKLAQDQVQESGRLLKLGTISDLDVIDARAGVAREQQAVIVAEESVIEAEGRLRTLIVGRPDWQPDDVIVPADPPETSPVSYSISEHMDLGRKNRPDLIAAHAALLAAQAELAVTENAQLPLLDLLVTGGVIGFSGQLAHNYVTQGIIDNTLSPPYVVDPSSSGGVGTAAGNMFRSGDYTVSVAVRLELPLGNHEAKVRNSRQRHEVERARLAEQALLSRVENEVRTSLAVLKSYEELEHAADDAVSVNEKLLAGMRKRYSAGALTSFDVLRVADELARSQIEAARARVNYRIALARLATADGTLLDKHHVTLKSLRAPTARR